MMTCHLSRFALAAAMLGGLVLPAHAGYLFFSLEDFPIPAFAAQSGTKKEYSQWDNFYASDTAGNFPDVYAPFGGVFDQGAENYVPQARSETTFPSSPFYDVPNAAAFWDNRNATIAQSATAAIIAGSGNIYSFAGPTSYVLKDSTADATSPYKLGTVMFQFQTDGTMVDFSSIYLRYTNGTGTHQIAATEYLREFLGTDASDPSAANAFRNRVSLQWDLTGLDIDTYEIAWSSQSSSMSFQRAVLDTADTYGTGVPASRTWTGTTGNWSAGANWSQGTTTVENGNVKFGNASAATVSLDGNHTIGEMIFQTAANVTINRPGSQKIVANTGISTTALATGSYTINTAWEFGATNIFELNAGTVRLGGPVSGSYGMLKKGEGTLVLGGVAGFTGGITLWGGTLRLEGANTYAGGNSIITGRLEIAANSPRGAAGALGASTAVVNLGADSSLFANVGGNAAAILIEGDRTVGQYFALAAGNFEKRLGAYGTTVGATYSGNVDFANASNVKFTAQGATDRVIFSGALTGGSIANTLTSDGAGTVVLSGAAAKSFANATTVAAGTLELATGAEFTGAGNWQVNSGAKLRVNGMLSGAGTLTLTGGTLGGSGTVNKSVTIASGSRLAPGVNAGTLTLVGSQSWESGGAYEWQVTNAGQSGGWDFVQVNGSLALSGQFTIYARSITMDGILAAATGFDGGQNYQWIIATASGGISGFFAGNFAVDASGFTNANGTFNVSQIGDSLFLNYAAVPEPGTWALLALGGAALFGVRRAQRKQFTANESQGAASQSSPWPSA